MTVAGSVLLYVQYIIRSPLLGFRGRLSAVSGTVFLFLCKGLCSTWCTVSDSTITVLYMIIVVLI